jgi:hypothetical protein
MSRIGSILATVMLLLGSVIAFGQQASAQDTVTLTLNLATCDIVGSADSIGIEDAFDETALGCDSSSMSWAEPPHFLLNGTPADGGDNATTVVFSGLVPGTSYTLTENNGVGVFDDGYTFTAPDSDLELWAVLYAHYVPDETDNSTDTSDSSSSADSVEVSSLPDTGTGSIDNEGTMPGFLLVFAAMVMAAAGAYALRMRQPLR